MQHPRIEGSFDPNIMASIGRLLSEMEKGMTDEQIRHNSADVFFVDFVPTNAQKAIFWEGFEFIRDP